MNLWLLLPASTLLGMDLGYLSSLGVRWRGLPIPDQR